MVDGSDNQRVRQRLETHNRLFELAIEEFRKQGVDKARIRDIVERAGVVPGTFYFHFPSKEHVLLDCLEAEMQAGRVDSDLSAGELSQIILMAFFGTLLTAPDDPTLQTEQIRRTLGFFEDALLRPNDRGEES